MSRKSVISSPGSDGEKNKSPPRMTPIRATSLHFDDTVLSKPLDLRNLVVPKLPRQQTLYRTVARPLDWTGAPESPFVKREDSEREMPVTHVEAGFQVLPANSPLRLTLDPPKFHTHHRPPPLSPAAAAPMPHPSKLLAGLPSSASSNPFNDGHALRPLYGSPMSSRKGGAASHSGGELGEYFAKSLSGGGGGGWEHTQGPASPKGGTGGRGARFVASPSTTRHGRPAHYSQTFRGSPQHAQNDFPKIRRVPAPLSLKFTSPLSGARSLEHRHEIMREHGLEASVAYSGPGVDAEEEEGRSKLAVLKLKPFIKDTHATLTWDLSEPLKKWKRVRTDASGSKVTGLSLVSTRLEGDLAELGPLFGAFEHLQLLLIHSNERVTGDIHWLCTLFALDELRLSAARMNGDIIGFSALLKLRKLMVYNRKKEDLKGLVVDLQRQMPGCSIDVDIKTHDGI